MSPKWELVPLMGLSVLGPMVPDSRYVGFALVIVAFVGGRRARLQWSDLKIRFGREDLVAAALLLAGLAVFAGPVLAEPNTILRNAQALGPWFVIYPIFSVLPQEIVYRAYFHEILGRTLSPYPLIVASALNFSLLHIMYAGTEVLLISFLGGLVFAWLYRSKKSFGKVFFWHTIAGLAAFSCGMAELFHKRS